MQLRIVDTELYLDSCHTRLPFRFGMHTLTQAPLALLHVTIEANGRTVDGYASDLLVPKWFEKNAAKTPAQDVASLIDSVHKATARSTGRRGTAFELWHGAYEAATADIPGHAADRLVHGYGPALLERALIDAACRAADMPFHRGLQSDVLGMDLALLDPSVESWSPASLRAPRTSITLRHTVGMLDVLREVDLDNADRINDGLPKHSKPTSPPMA